MGKSRYSKAIKGEYDRKKLEANSLDIKNYFQTKKKPKDDQVSYNNKYYNGDDSFLSSFLSFIGSIF